MADNLEDLQKKLYTPEKPVLPEVKTEAVLPESSIAPPPFAKDSEPSPAIWKKIFLGAAVFIVLATSAAIFIFYSGFYTFRKDKIELRLEAPTEIVAGQALIWKLGIVNNNETELKDAELVFQFPDFSKPIISIGESNQFKDGPLKQKILITDIKAGGLYEREFKATVYGGDNFERKAQAVFKFKPSAGNIVFQSVATAATKITSFPVALTMEATPQTISGETVEIKFHLKNESDANFQNLRVRLEFPSGFRIDETSEKLSEFNNVWKVDQLLSQESKDLTVKGVITGLEGENKIFGLFAESLEGSNWKAYKESSGEIKLITAPLSLYLNTDPDGLNFARPGDFVSYKFIWQNNLDAPLSNLTLKIKLDSDNFDFSTLNPSKGFDATSRTITLNADNYPAFFGIQPSEKGELTIRLRVKQGLTSTNLKLPVSAIMESTTKPEGLSVSKISASQNLTLDIKTGE